jgi:hypothetical protein
MAAQLLRLALYPRAGSRLGWRGEGRCGRGCYLRAVRRAGQDNMALGRRRIPSTVFGSVTSERKETMPTSVAGVAATQREKRRMRRLRLRPVGPARYRGPRPREKRDAAGPKGEKRGAGFWPEAEKDIISISFSFSNTLNIFSNDF